ncbi:MAG TPA: hypothetical protein PKV71_12125 [Calditrichia bacterium]|nr:hypothetical protein [Calditrichia bacterium]
MKKTINLMIVGLLTAFLMQCGGGKKLSPSELNNLSTQDRIAYLQEQSNKNPDDLEVKKQLYKSYLDIKMDAQAAKVMEDIIKADPSQADIQFEYGELQYNQGNQRAAYQAFLNVMNSGSGSFYKEKIAQYVSGNYLVQRVTNSPADEGFPSFSPDGTKLVFQKFNGQDWVIVQYDLASQTEQMLVQGPGDDESPVYSPSGAALAFTSTADDHRPVESKVKVREIKTIQLNDQFKANLTQSVSDDWLPRFSNDGQQMIFVSERSDLRKVGYLNKQSDLFIMESDGDFQRRLTKSDANEGGACFSADDKRIFFHSNKNRGQYDIFTIKPDGSQMMTVVDHPANDVNPACSPDGNYIAFVTDRDGNYEIYRSRVDGSIAERLTFNNAIDGSPAYSPDGSILAFHSNRDGNYNIFVINLGYATSEMSSADLISRLEELTR